MGFMPVRAARFSRRSRVAIMGAAFAVLVAGTVPASAQSDAFEPNDRPHSVAIDWIEAMLDAIELNPPAPTATTWRMHLTIASMYDAFAAFDRDAVGTVTGYDLKQPRAARTVQNQEIAVSYAAHAALTFVFPNQADIFDAVLELHGLSPSDSLDPTTPAGVGNLAAEAVIAHRVSDGSNALAGFADLPSDLYPDYYQPYNSADPSSTYSLGGADFDPNRWTPLRVPNGTLLDENGNPTYDDADPTTFTDQSFLTPHWGSVDSFALESGDQFRPPAPPQLGSSELYEDALGNVSTNDEAFRQQTATVLEISGDLVDEHKVIAEFWADGPHTWTPPGHWVQIAVGISIRDQHTLAEDMELYLALTGAVLDAGIAAWDAKRTYDFVRPATAIRHLYQGQLVEAWAGPNLGIQLIDGDDWQPYQSTTFVTPPFAEYVSGHSTFSRAAAEVLTAYTGAGAFYDGVTQIGRDYDGDGVEDLLGQHVVIPGGLMFEDGPAETVVLRWSTFVEAADEAGFSRLYGGIHFQDGDRRAREMGRQIGVQAYAHAEMHWDPFGEIRETLRDHVQSGDLDRRTGRLLAVRLLLVNGWFDQGRTALACRMLDRVGDHVEANTGRTISDDAASAILDQLGVVSDLAC